MLTPTEKEIIIRCAKKHGVSQVTLFGSMLEEGRDARDIDLGVRGLVPERFFKFWGELLRELGRPVDVVDLSEESKFVKIVEDAE